MRHAVLRGTACFDTGLFCVEVGMGVSAGGEMNNSETKPPGLPWVWRSPWGSSWV